MSLPPYPRVALRSHEWQHQAAVISWATAAERQIPELKWLHASANGSIISFSRNNAGQAFSRQGKRAKDTGVKKGIPDLNWPIPRGPYHGCWIELKRPEAKAPVHLEDEQITCLEFLAARGYFVAFANDCTTAVQLLLRYWSAGPFDLAAARVHDAGVHPAERCPCCADLDVEVTRRAKARRKKK